MPGTYKAQLVLFVDDAKHPTSVYTFDASKIDIVMTPGSGDVDKASLEGVLTEVFHRRQPEQGNTTLHKHCSHIAPHIQHVWHDESQNYICPGNVIE